MADLEDLKKVLRSLVVSSAATMDAASLLRDYRCMLGEPLPSAKHGYRNPIQFLRERCSDCFLFAGPQTNPILTLIVPDSIKHIDQLVQSQKTSNSRRGKRRSVPESIIKKPQHNLISSTFQGNNRIPNGKSTYTPNRPNKHTERPEPRAYVEPRKPEPVISERKESQHVEPRKSEPLYTCKAEPAPQIDTKPVNVAPMEVKKPEDSEAPSVKVETQSNGHSELDADPQTQLQRFLKKQMPAYQAPTLGSKESLRDHDSGRMTTSSLREQFRMALANLQSEILRLVERRPEGIWCSDLLRLYEEEYGRELNFSLWYPSVSACACAVEGVASQRAPDGNWLLTVKGREGPIIRSEPMLRLRRARPPLSASKLASMLDADDALPGIDYDPDVFPADCLSFLESIPAGSLAGVAPGAMLPLQVAEVYSPSHLWLQLLGPDHDRMDDIMDQMTKYYSRGEGAERVLSLGARRPGQYCSSMYEGDWHRSLIVQLVDSDTVKVRHVDYGTVETVPAASLRPLKREWAALPAQAVRARLAGLRPAAAGRRWPRAAAAYCLHLVRDRRLMGNVVQVDHEESSMEVLLIDTSTSEDINLTELMIRAGYADAWPHLTLGARDGYLLPTFSALETGATPNYALLRDGIALDFVDSYRNHVASLLPTDSDDAGEAPACSPPPAPPLAASRVPTMSLLRLPATPEPTPETELSLLWLDTPEPSPEPNSTPAASPNEQSAQLDSSVPDIQQPCLTPLPFPAQPLSPAPAPAPSPPAPAPPCCPSPARAPHPASAYALPYCPCSAVYKPQPPARPVPVSMPVVWHCPPGYFRPRVSPQQHYPQFRPPVSLNYYGPNLAGQPIYHQNPQNFPPAQYPQNSMPNSTHNPQQFVPNSIHNPQQFVPNSTHNPQKFVPNSMQNHQQFVRHPAPQNFKPVPPTNFVSYKYNFKDYYSSNS